MINKSIILVVGLLLLLFLPANAQDNSIIQKLISEGRTIKGMLEWDVAFRNPLLCIYSSDSNDSTWESSELSIYRKDSSGYTEIFNKKDLGSLVGIFQDCEYKGNLIVLSVTNSYGITVFSYFDGKVQLSLNDGDRIMPEFVFSNFNTEYNIVLTYKDWVMNKQKGESELIPVNSTIYKWNHNHYDTLYTSYKKRFDTMLKSK